MGRLQTKKGNSKKYIEEQIANIANIAFKWQLKEIKFKSFQLQAIRNKNIQKDLKSIILVLLQLCPTDQDMDLRILQWRN